MKKCSGCDLLINNSCSAEVLCSRKFPDLHTKKTKIVCLCGSTKFKDAFEKATKEESLKGSIVLTVAMFGHLEGLDMDGDSKKIFDELHFRKIELCDEVLVLNVNGYIGESTRREIQHAEKNGKFIRYLE